MHTRQPKKVLDVPGTPLEIRCAWAPENRYCFTSTAPWTSQIWLIYEDDQGEMAGQGGRRYRRPVYRTASRRHFNHVRRQGVVGRHLSGRQSSILRHLRPICAKTGLRKSDWKPNQHGFTKLRDGKRVYFSSSLLARWDKLAEDDEQYVKLYHLGWQ